MADVDATRVIERLARKIAQLTVDNAVLEEAVEAYEQRGTLHAAAETEDADAAE